MTLTLGQAFQMAYRRYIEKEKKEIQKNKELLTLEKQIEEMKNENQMLKRKVSEKLSSEGSSMPDVSLQLLDVICVCVCVLV